MAGDLLSGNYNDADGSALAYFKPSPRSVSLVGIWPGFLATDFNFSHQTALREPQPKIQLALVLAGALLCLSPIAIIHEALRTHTVDMVR